MKQTAVAIVTTSAIRFSLRYRPGATNFQSCQMTSGLAIRIAAYIASFV